MSEKLVISYPIDHLPNQVVGHQICLNNIGRANALVPELISALAAALDEAENAQAKLIILCANGKHFSTGGDIQRFSAACANGNGEDYARNLVSQLQAVVLKMLSMPAIIIVGAQGAITGGSCGLFFAADIGVLDRTSFIQPFYREVGFAPDGGWTALLPEIIGPKHAAAILHQNLQIDANQAVQMGIAQHIAEHEDVTAKAHAIALELASVPNIAALIAAKQLIWTKDRLSVVEAGLDAETQAFIDLFNQPHMPTTLDNFRPSRAG